MGFIGTRLAFGEKAFGEKTIIRPRPRMFEDFELKYITRTGTGCENTHL
jgi:hypothetical protein